MKEKKKRGCFNRAFGNVLYGFIIKDERNQTTRYTLWFDLNFIYSSFVPTFNSGSI